MMNARQAPDIGSNAAPSSPDVAELRRSVTARLDSVRTSMPDEEFVQLVNCVTWFERYK